MAHSEKEMSTLLYCLDNVGWPTVRQVLSTKERERGKERGKIDRGRQRGERERECKREREREKRVGGR